jgi:hypothetical protein
MDKMKTTRTKDFAVTLENNDGKEITIEVTALNEKFAKGKALKLHPDFHATNKMLKAADKKAVKTAKAVKKAKAAKKPAKATKAPKLTKKDGLAMVDLTYNQALVMKYLITEMANWKDSEPTFSHVGINEVMDLFPNRFVGGAVISTLIEKGLITKGETPSDNKKEMGKYIIDFTPKSQKLR